MPMERLQKLLARAGFGSRRACEEIVLAGRVTVDGKIVTELGSKADLDAQDVRIDNERVKPERPEYWILNKPKNVVCTNLDPAGRQRAIDLMVDLTPARLFPVGRLDADSKGLLIMTNDGEFTNALTHPRYGVPKTYVATVAGDLAGPDMQRLVRGVWLAEGRTNPARVRRIKRGRSKSLVEVTLSEGRNRQVRRMLAKLGHNVRELVRTRVGTISMHGLKLGQARRLTPEEVAYLRTLPNMEAPKRRPPREGRRPAGEAAEPQDDRAAEGARPRREGARQAREGARPEREGGRPGRESARPPREGARPTREGARPRQGARFDKRREMPTEGGPPRRDVRRSPKERRPPATWRPRGSPPPQPSRGYDEDNERPVEGQPSHPFMAQRPEAEPTAAPGQERPPEARREPGRCREERPAGSKFRGSPAPRGKFDKSGPPRRDFDKRGGPPRGKFDKSGPPRGKFDKSGPPRREFDKRGPSRGKFDKSGPPRRDFNERGPSRDKFGNERPARGKFGEGGPPRREFDKRRGPPRGKFDKSGPPRGKFGEGGPPRGKFGEGGPPRGPRRPDDPEKRSFTKHDANGRGKAGEGDRRDAGRGPGGRPGGRGGPPRSGRRPGGHHPQ